MARKIENLENEIYNIKEQKEIKTHVQKNKAETKEKLLSCNACEYKKKPLTQRIVLGIKTVKNLITSLNLKVLLFIT